MTADRKLFLLFFFFVFSWNVFACLSSFSPSLLSLFFLLLRCVVLYCAVVSYQYLGENLERRNLFKAVGIRIVAYVGGRGGRFDLATLLTNIGAGRAVCLCCSFSLRNLNFFCCFMISFFVG